MPTGACWSYQHRPARCGGRLQAGSYSIVTRVSGQFPASPCQQATPAAVRGSAVCGLVRARLAEVDKHGEIIERRGRYRLAGRPPGAAPPPADEAEAVEPALQHVTGAVLLHPRADVEA